MRVLQDFSRQNLRDLNKTTSALQQELKQVMMLPCASLLDAVPRRYATWPRSGQKDFR
jgi:hypothetical protein